jgi:hypothetical protein
MPLGLWKRPQKGPTSLGWRHRHPVPGPYECCQAIGLIQLMVARGKPTTFDWIDEIMP